MRIKVLSTTVVSLHFLFWAGSFFSLRKTIALNIPLLTHAAHAWISVFDFDATGGPRTPPLHSLTRQVPWSPGTMVCILNIVLFTGTLKFWKGGHAYHTLPQKVFFYLQPSKSIKLPLPLFWQVKAFWSLIYADDPAHMPGKVSRHADAWGVRKMLSHIFRNMRLARLPRDLWR